MMDRCLVDEVACLPEKWIDLSPSLITYALWRRFIPRTCSWLPSSRW